MLSKSEKLYRDLRAKIEAGKLETGSKISENKLAAEHGISRTPIRQVLQRLAEQGYLEIRPKSGTYVRGISDDKHVELLQVRCALEGLGYRIAVERDEELSFEKVDRLLDKLGKEILKERPSFEKISQWHHEFHRELIALSGNETLMKIYSEQQRSLESVFQASETKAERLISQREHVELVDLLKSRDRKGEKLIYQQLEKVISSLRK